MLLKTIAGNLKNNKRTTDAVGRYRREEFIGVYSDVEEKNIMLTISK
jgi:GGDEF domain-containing protein